MNKEKEIKKLRKEAKKYYLAYCATADSYSCGLSLAEHISSELTHYKIEFNKVMDRLAELDPLAPDTRL